MSSVSSAPRLYPDSGLHFKCYACLRSGSVQYWTFSKIIGSYQQCSTAPQKPSRIMCARITQSLVGLKLRLARCPVLKKFIVIVYTYWPQGY